MRNLSEAIRKSKEFIFLGRDNLGLWKDFETRTNGESIDWISAYVGLSLLQSGIPITELELTAKSISERQDKEYGGWGYNQKIVPDADSTAFSILFLSNFGYDLARTRGFLLKHQKSDGSFGTYLPRLIRQYYRISSDMSINGWCSGTPDITATALQALGNRDNSVEYLRKTQDEQGFWRSYWFNNDIYSTVQGIRAMKNHNPHKPIKKAQEWLSKQKLIPEIPFYLALSTQGFMTNEKYLDEVQIRISRLLDLQLQDGSWESYPLLRFPLPSNLEPWNDGSRWREEAKDQNRFFTTATCLQTLVEYEKLT